MKIDNNYIEYSQNSIKRLKEVNETFQQNVIGRPQAERIRADIQVEKGNFVIDCFGYAATAAPRIVKIDTEGFAMEYVFYVERNERRIEVGRFYLTVEGELRKTTTEDNPICSSNNTIIADYICGHLLQSALESSLFDPEKMDDGQRVL